MGVSLKCTCGQVRGRVHDTSSSTFGHRIICYCDDCQALAQFLGRPELVDAIGGSDIFQTAIGNVELTLGREHIRCVRLGPKGMFRWYTDCCKSPLGNTLGPGVPFVGMPSNLVDRGEVSKELDALLGPVRWTHLAKFAKGGLPSGASARPSFAMLARIVRLLLTWKLTGKAWPSPFFDAGTRAPVVEPKVLTASEREALRSS